MLECWRAEGLAPARGAHADHELMNGFYSGPASASGYSMKGFVKCPHCHSANATGPGDMGVAATGHVAKGACHAFVGGPSCEQWVSAINDFSYCHPERPGCAARPGQWGGGTQPAQCPQLVYPSSRRQPPAVCARPAAAASPPSVCTPTARPAASLTADGGAVEPRAAAWLSAGPAQMPAGSHMGRPVPAQPGTPAMTPASPKSGSTSSPGTALAEAQQLVDRGKQQMAEMDFGSAAASFKAATRALAGQPYSLAGRTLWEESLLDLAQCQLNMQQYDACVDTCTKFMAAAGGSPTAFCAQYNCGCALLALGDFAGAVQQLELAAAAAPEPQRATVQELLQEVQHALQATVASQEQHHAPVMPQAHHRAADEEPAGAAAPPAACLRCCRGRLDGALMHGTTLHICVCWSCACELAEQRKPCPKCHARIDQIARVG